MTRNSSAHLAFRCTATLLLLVFMAGCSDDPAEGDDACTGSECANRDRDLDRAERDVGVDDDTGTADGALVDNGSDVDPSDAEGELPGCGPGRLEGRVCAPNEEVWIGGATVVVTGTDCDGESFSFETTSDSQGYYEIDDIPSGEHTVILSKGSFRAETDVNIRHGGRTDLVTGEEKACLEDVNIEIAVVSGGFDSIETVLDSMGLTYTFYVGDEQTGTPGEIFLMDGSAMALFDIIFINCGQQNLWYGALDPNPEAGHQLIADNIRGFVDSGGSVYLSDWAFFFLERAWPSNFHFSDNDPDFDDALRGEQGVVSASVVSDEMLTALGTENLTIDMPSRGWVFADSVSGDVIEHVVAASVPTTAGGTVSNVPLLFSYQPSPSSGRVFFTSFHNEVQIDEPIERLLQHIVFSL